MKRIDHNVRYVAFAASGAALLWLAMAGIVPVKHPLRPNEYLIDTSTHSPRTMRNFFRRQDVVLALTFVFATAGPSLVLPADFNTASNQINAIGSGTGGAGGGNGSTTGGCCPSVVGGPGGAAGAGGAFARIVNYAGHTAGQTVNCTVGSGDTVFDTSSILLAKAGSGSTGGSAAASVGTTKFSGGNGGAGGFVCGFSGGGGGAGGAAGPNGAGNNGANGLTQPAGFDGGAGASADAGSGGGGGAGGFGNPGTGSPGGAGGNGTEFNASHGSGGGGGGGGGVAGGFIGN
jgi:hypothetical protein